MLTSSLISMAKREFPDWSRTMLLSLLNEVQRMVFTQNTTNHMRMYDSTTGKDPLLTTTSGTYSYDIDTSNGFSYDAWRITHVYTTDIDDPEDVLCFDGSRGVSAKVVFKSDPGSTDYYIKVYRQCTSITSESVQLEIPEAYHLSHIYEGLCGLVEKYRSGKSERWEVFKQVLMPEVVKKMSDAGKVSYSVTYKGY